MVNVAAFEGSAVHIIKQDTKLPLLVEEAVAVDQVWVVDAAEELHISKATLAELAQGVVVVGVKNT